MVQSGTFQWGKHMARIGEGIGRKEDLRFVTGRGRYTADIETPDALHAVFVRSPVAFGRIAGIDSAAAAAAPGVAAVLTGREAAADGLGHIPTGAPVTNRDGTPMHQARRPVLPEAQVHHVGQPLAVVLARTRAKALAAAELVEIDIEESPPALECARAPAIHDGIPENMAFDWEAGDFEAASKAVADAPRRVDMRFHQNRMVGGALEGLAAQAEYDAGAGQVVLTAATQGAHALKVMLTKFALNWPRERLRVIVPDVGGGFGPKGFVYQEQAAVAWACWRLKRPVRWVSERAESFVSEVHARDQFVTARMGFNDEGRILAVTMDVDADMGAFLSGFAPGVPTDGMAKVLTGLYDVSVAGLRVRGFYTNTVPVDAYRGAGKPPAIYCLERLVDLAAGELGLDPVEIRRRNLVPADALPYTTATGKVLDAGGDYAAALQSTAHALDWNLARRDGPIRRGVGICCNLHPIGGSSAETSRVTVSGDGRIVAWTGTQSTGQGHETVFAQILADRLGVPVDLIDVRQGDTAQLRRGGGTGGSSSTVISGSTLTRTADEVIRLGKARAADLLETAAADIEYAGGHFSVAGTDRRVSLFDVAGDDGLEAEQDFADQVAAFPYGAVGAEVEIDTETGAIRLTKLVSCDDAGRIINPVLLAGQSHGALVQGAGQALWEHAAYDLETGQLVAGTFMDYAMPRAGDLPAIGAEFIETLSPTNILGARGIGEMGANGAPVAIANAVYDALRGLGVTDLEPPFTPHRIWRAIRAAQVV
ncbi:carbon monoxide dehydrogenase [Minwuia thermotolerans]|uniref:Carbon monoxide dehydrogenase n=2 Tax=Minwuia thermotolerans TaxID=2056226 RepID=A0A2M9G690_9PROT|nr:carbon monoxide dehydrogenase [Minwuia thermotolerans]